MTCVKLQCLFDLFELDADKGLLYRRKGLGGRSKGSIAGWACANGYLYVSVRNQKFLVHRVIWCMVNGKWPLCDLDHINGVRSDNRISNLRLASRSENLANRKLSRSTSGYKGVSWHKRARKWAAYIGSRSGPEMGREHLGLFDSAEEAHKAYLDAAKRRFGEFATSGVRSG